MRNGRTNYAALLADVRQFLFLHSRLLIFLTLMLVGVMAGIWVFSASHVQLLPELDVMLKLHPFTGGFAGGMAQLMASCVSLFIILALLFLSGLSACGAPVALLVPLFYGMGLGLTEAYYYATAGSSGVGVVALLVLPHNLVAAASLTLGCAESLRMSLRITRQLLSSGALGGLWQDFRLYCVRFLLFAVIAFSSGVVDVCMRLAGNGLFL